MNHPDKYIKDLILRFLNKEASDDEISELLYWLKLDEKNRQYFDEVNETFQTNTVLGNFTPEKVDSSWQQVAKRIEEDNEIKLARTTISTRYYNFLRVAASISIVFIASFVLWRYYYQQSEGVLSKAIVHNSLGRNTQILLPDSTLVWLNTNSTLQYNSNFGESTREVTLHGEAFFDVRKKKGQNFIVKTDQLSIRVKGTKFNVRAYEGEDANTTLEEGKVELTISGQDQTYSMRPGDQITVANKEQKIIFQKVNPSNFSAWKEDTLVFDNTPLSQIIVKLENRYKVKIIIDQVLAERERLTMTISQETIDEILEMIQLSSRLSYRKEKNHILIYE
jgi:transmembrane sensor